MDRTMTEQAAASAAATARLDPLTSLHTQDYLIEEIARVLERCRHGELQATLALLQLENFYEIRTWVGRSEADLLLGDIARRLESCVPDSALLCRCEHYEFALLLFNDSSANSHLITDRISRALQSATLDSIPPQLELKCAVGLAGLDGNIPSPDVVFARARHHLSLGLHQRSTALKGWLTPEAALPRVRKALRRGELKLYFQPLISLRPDGMARYEVRCGLAQAQSGLPAQLLFETAVQNALGEAIDRWVISRVLARPEKAHFIVNLTLNSLVSTGFFQWLHTQVQGSKPAPGQLQLQISEIDVLIAQHHMSFLCEQLRQLGIDLTVSHFGCTHDPLRYLPLLRAQGVKLDVSLLEKINVDPEIRENLGHTVEKLHARGLRVSAGMVNELRLLPYLWDAGVNLVQGNCLRPSTPDTDYDFPAERVLQLD